jgi:hypothetical protein
MEYNNQNERGERTAKQEIYSNNNKISRYIQQTSSDSFAKVSGMNQT